MSNFLSLIVPFTMPSWEVVSIMHWDAGVFGFAIVDFFVLYPGWLCRAKHACRMDGIGRDECTILLGLSDGEITYVYEYIKGGEDSCATTTRTLKFVNHCNDKC